ncbi:XTP/dITP diphosphatase [Apilactobacillus micheneri]|uniref:dITP/XTP pyrophosphatase n=1 Tax=Apilactobacillus micheneri TaxID=1899430 RepID=A0ABY2YWR9_9LACO|nr:XTP/dITP diphosphatase [Apilactobacillus micheneri]TPR24371.1 XTP/dITP diphosphatase [Apilactobacillus micheneri]TPR25390.1 XTP/dITP diphosphatase [Apilactobacillus micheneri]TPR27702.1 XTP/dITP diphosphatase [Apilactobacillus micheneri]TPR28967.1 XTP/dITP diphosphatase [Apilactobacillus micheneri]TPR29989.1 XTP/dITP diphosphatase [Apilactobacillus micheneri]
MLNTIVIATNNENKAIEFRNMFASKNINFKTLKDFPEIGAIKEDGNSFEENATIKAQAVHRMTNLPVLADDSGLQVHVINDEPGIYSARYAGDHDDSANNKKLLNKLSGKKNRSANFKTCLVLIKHDGKKLVVNGELNGTILEESRGDNGFGYDPLFYVPSMEKTLAQMNRTEKNKISHRGNAMKKLFNEFDNWWLN